MEPDTQDTPEEVLLKWFSNLRPLTLDIVGDFAGRELFVVHGESLLRYCLEDSQVDLEDGLQLLHAVHAVEKFLGNLYRRGLNFDIVFFRTLSDVCVPSNGSFANHYRYLFTRRVLIRHLSRNGPIGPDGSSPSVLECDSPEDKKFKTYLENHPVHFIYCHDGHGSGRRASIAFRQLIRTLVSWGRNVAVINSVEWKSSKVFSRIIKGARDNLAPLDFSHWPVVSGSISDKAKSIFLALEDELLEHSPSGIQKTLSSRMSVAICRAIRTSTHRHDLAELGQQIQAIMLHRSILHQATLDERRCPKPEMTTSGQQTRDQSFLRNFCEVAALVIQEKQSLLSSSASAEWDIYDLVDGRVFFTCLARLRAGLPFHWAVVENSTSMLKAVHEDTVCEIPIFTPDRSSPSFNETETPSVMAFSHPVVDTFLEGMNLKQAPEPHDPRADVVFRDLTHWHNMKLVNNSKKPTKPSFHMMRNIQRLEGKTVSYAASLTDSRGKILEPETVIVESKKPAATRNGHTKQRGVAGAEKAAGNGPRTGKGKAAALEAAKALNSSKAQSRGLTAVSHWAKRCAELEDDAVLVSRYLKADRIAREVSTPDVAAALGCEPELYVCHVLGKIWGQLHRKGDSGNHAIASMWNRLHSCANHVATPAVMSAVAELSRLLQTPSIPLEMGTMQRPLAFPFDLKALRPFTDQKVDFRELQLEYGGPYMDRRFESQPDDRVRFEPDAWQRRVLDSIDANNSLLVIAPTSAGKTFISFYAMKKVLQRSDDGVLVYVAPTKALVNQVAAEIQARLSKQYGNRAAKSVWGVYTRDYRVHNSRGCQILVTVPHMLQIMLLSQSDAGGSNSWANRVERIIFDEVHCIGQSEDGIVWEQLLLQAPCPIIALSATVGNPEAFCDWLSLSQSRKGYKLDMVVHNVRYSDLRKFIYEPPKEEKSFDGFDTVQRLPVPGLDEGGNGERRDSLKFLHPIVAFSDRNPHCLANLSFEARDCLTLWRRLNEMLSADQLRRLGIRGPQTALPEVISKSDVINWEKDLKDGLLRGMECGVIDLQKLRAPFDTRCPGVPTRNHKETLFALACDLQALDALPALVFNFDRAECEGCAEEVFTRLVQAERTYKSGDPSWLRKLRDFEQWKKSAARAKTPHRAGGKSGGDKDSEKFSKLEAMMEAASVEASSWESFDPNDPLEQFSLADHSKIQRQELYSVLGPVNRVNLHPWLIDALRRGIGVHHAGMNLAYRQAVEILFRRGFLRFVIATGTLALGINMPCKTVVFSGGSVFLTAQNYRQCSGRAGRRGFDLLGNVVFNGIPRERVYEIMSMTLPDLHGQFPISTSMILRLMNLLHGTENSQYAIDVTNSLFSQTRLYMGGPETGDSVRHHLRFAIEYLRCQRLLSSSGEPLNFAGLVQHLYFVENSAFAFHSLLKGGYFHGLCASIDSRPDGVLLEMMLVLSHLFNRIPIRRRSHLEKVAHRSSSVVFLPRLPGEAESLIARHNEETFSIFTDYVRSYISHNLKDTPDETMPYTKTTLSHGGRGMGMRLLDDATPPCIMRSPFSALSGFTDSFASVHDLCSSVRDGVFLEESAIPYMPIWPRDTTTQLNAYLYDFYKHGSLEVLVRDNGIRRGDVWFLLKDFSLSLAAICTSMEAIFGADLDEDSDGDDASESGEPVPRNSAPPSRKNETIGAKETETKKKKTKAKDLDSWEDDDDAWHEEQGADGQGTGMDGGAPGETPPPSDAAREPAWVREGSSLEKVFRAFTMLQHEFEAKFRNVWA